MAAAFFKAARTWYVVAGKRPGSTKPLQKLFKRSVLPKLLFLRLIKIYFHVITLFIGTKLGGIPIAVMSQFTFYNVINNG